MISSDTALVSLLLRDDRGDESLDARLGWCGVGRLESGYCACRTYHAIFLPDLHWNKLALTDVLTRGCRGGERKFEMIVTHFCIHTLL